MKLTKELYNALKAMLARLGADGEINLAASEVVDVMTELEKVDGGAYRPDEWISVEERLPEDAGLLERGYARYLVWEKAYNNHVIGFWYGKDLGWETQIAEDYSEVTHWQPLPDPPKGE